MFFLISYGLLNYATYVEAHANSPSFRPRFRFFDKRLSLLGCLACLGAMLAINPTAGVVAVVVLFGLHQYIARSVEHERWAESRIASRVKLCLDAVGLRDVESKMPSELSGGMRKRVGVARGIAMEPAVILYDEPTTGLDPANQRRIGELIRDLQSRLRVTSVVVTHDLQLCFSTSDRIGLLHEGRIVQIAAPEEIRRAPGPEAREFLEGATLPGAPA